LLAPPPFLPSRSFLAVVSPVAAAAGKDGSAVAGVYYKSDLGLSN
jgi:hypothetical protein